MISKKNSIIFSTYTFLIFSTVFSVSTLFSQNSINNSSVLVGTFWYDSRIFLPNSNDDLISNDSRNQIPYSKDFEKINLNEEPFREIRRTLMEEAYYVFSGMVYGWRFSYRPGDKHRKIKEFFNLVPIAEIMEEDRHLEKISTMYRDSGLIQMQISYHIDEKRDKNYVLFRESPSLHFATGSGFSKIGREFLSRRAAIEDSIKNAIHFHQKIRLRDKPERIEGVIFLEQTPKVRVVSGKFIAESRVVFQIKMVKKYIIL